MAAKKIYTITTDGLSNGLTIAQPFTIEVKDMYYPEDKFIVHVQTITNGGMVTPNDDIPDAITDLDEPSPITGISDLSAFETVYLDDKYPSNWS